MVNGVRRNPFEVGEQYRNEDGIYTVVRMEAPNMVIRYANGRTLQSSIKLQARIWERLREEEATETKAAEVTQAAHRASTRRSRTSLGRDFHGLQKTDFRADVNGTSWRRRTELAGLLSARLSDLSGQIFDSHAVYRRAEVYIVQAKHWASERSHHAAKFYFGLSETGASYGFYVEKPNEPMDGTWDWMRVLAALAEDKRLQARTLVAMENCNLQWRIYPGGDAVTESAAIRVTAEQEALYLQKDGESTPIEWANLVDLLRAVPDDQRCDAYLATSMENTRGIELGVSLAQEVAVIYDALLPLYAASV